MEALFYILVVVIAGVTVIRLLPLVRTESERSRFWRAMR